MAWTVSFHPDFESEFANFDENVADELLAYAGLLEKFGPNLKRPHADTLAGSKHKNLKELRFVVEKHEWRVAYAFDPRREAILLVGGDKTGTNEGRFYKALITKAEARYDDHLAGLEENGK